MIVQEAELDPKYQSLWKKALISAERKNWEYVIDQVLPIVKDNIGFLDGRKLLRSAEGEVSGGAKKGFSLGGGLFKGGSKKDPAEQIADLEETTFRKDPFNLNANEQLYDLAMKIHFPELAAFALETIRRGHPENTKNMHKLALHYMATSEPEKASEIYRAIVKVDPRDMDAAKGEKDAAARTSILRQGWDAADKGGNFKSAMKDSGEAAKPRADGAVSGRDYRAVQRRPDEHCHRQAHGRSLRAPGADRQRADVLRLRAQHPESG
jgi:hypothetical protein